MKISYTINTFGHATVFACDDNKEWEDLYFQSEADIESLATLYGLPHSERFSITSCMDHLYAHQGEHIDDPGYFI